jgi:hypothetical protein
MIMKRVVLVSILLLASTAGAHADYLQSNYYDTIRPHGKPRSNAIHQADINDCYARTGLARTAGPTPDFKQCMLSHGYRFQNLRNVQTSPIPHVPAGAIGTYTYDDVSVGPQRTEADEQAATRACDGGVSARIGEPAFNACMTRRGWRLAAFEPAPRDPTPAMADDEPSAASDTDYGEATRDAAIEATNAASLATSEAIAQASQAIAQASQAAAQP